MSLHTSCQYARCYEANCKSKNPLLSWYPKPYASCQHCSSTTSRRRLAKGWQHEGRLSSRRLKYRCPGWVFFFLHARWWTNPGMQTNIDKGFAATCNSSNLEVEIWREKVVIHISGRCKQMAGYLAIEGKQAMETSEGSSRSWLGSQSTTLWKEYQRQWQEMADPTDGVEPHSQQNCHWNTIF